MSAMGAARGERFSAVMAAIAGRLPFWPGPGYAVISTLTFSLDLALLTAFHGGLRWPLPVAVTAAYVLASGLGYLLNRTLNFRSHGAVGPQLTVYAAVVTVNFLALILGVSTGLAAMGLDYRLARLAAAACECVYMYAAMRWLVFRDAGPAGRGNTARKAAAGPGPLARHPPIRGPRSPPPRRMKMTQHVRVRTDQALLAVPQAGLGAESPHHGAAAAQRGPGHGREQVMLDLVVEAAEHGFGQPPAADVAGGENLLAQEVQAVLLAQHRHALVVGGERAAQVETEQPLLDGDEGQRPGPGQHEQDGREIAGDMQDEQQAFQLSASDRAVQHRPQADDVHAQRLEQQHREEQICLVGPMGESRARPPKSPQEPNGEQPERNEK